MLVTTPPRQRPSAGWLTREPTRNTRHFFSGLLWSISRKIGLYGVLEYLVSRRIREIGIRVALGARAQEIVRMVVSDGLRPVVLGLVAGLAVSLVMGRMVEALLFGITPRDPRTFAVVPLVLLLAALLAALVPARRASRVNPVEALRSE